MKSQSTGMISELEGSGYRLSSRRIRALIAMRRYWQEMTR